MKLSGKEFTPKKVVRIRPLSPKEKMLIELAIKGISYKEWKASGGSLKHIDPQPKNPSLIKCNFVTLLGHGYIPKKSSSKNYRVGYRFEKLWIQNKHRGKEDDLTCKQRRHLKFGNKYLSKKTFHKKKNVA